MISRLIETLLVILFNRAQGWRLRRSLPRHGMLPTAVGHVIVGHLLERRPTATPQEAITLSPEARRKHLYAIGATGCGKTNLMLRLIEADIANRQAVCVVDLRGDLVDRILLRVAASETPASLGKRLLLLDLRDMEHIVGFNPLAGDGDVYHRAFHLLSVLRHQSESWGVQLEETLRNALLALAVAGWSLLELEPLLTDAAFRATALSGVTDSQVQAFFRRYDRLSPERQQSYYLPVLNKVTPFLGLPALRLTLSARKSAFSFRELLDRTPGAVLLIALAVDRLHEAAHLVGGLLISALQNSVMARVDQPEADRVPVHLYIDEFETMATERFEAIIAEGRRFGIGLCLSHQNTGQLPNGLKHVIRNNVHGQFLFQIGALDASELAQEVNSKRPREQVRDDLVNQQVGECHLVRRGQPTVRLQVTHSPDPKVSFAEVQAIRDAALWAYARPRPDIERLLEERARLLSGRPDTPSDAPSPTPKHSYEVRHVQGKRPSK